MKNYLVIILGFSSLFLIDVIVSVFTIGGTQNDLYRNLLLFIGQLVTVASGIYSVGMYGLKSTTGRSLAFFTGGFLLFLLGGALFSYYDATLESSPFPSFADGLILFGYLFFLTGLLIMIRHKNLSIRKDLRIFLIVLAAILAIVVFYFEIFIPYDRTASLFVTLVQSAYGVGDLILIILFVFVLLLALTYQGGKMFFIWLFFFIGFILTLFGDVLFGIFVHEYLDKTGINVYIDLIWRSAYVFFGAGLFIAATIVKNVQSNLQRSLPKE